MRQPLRLFWARGAGKQSDSERNAGDWYSPLICERLSGRPILYASPKNCDLVAAGSLLHRLDKSHPLHRFGARRPLHVWGTGSLHADRKISGKLHLHAVRGSLTRQLTRENAVAASEQPALGDPGLLADLLLDRVPTKRFSVGVLPHYQDAQHPAVTAFLDENRHAVRLSVFMPVVDLLHRIAECEIVLSSSLHGLIFADSLGVANQWFTASDELVGGRHKFDDYYSCFPDGAMNPATLAAVDLQAVAEQYQRTGIDAIKRALAARFPDR